ncbi:hypothetical protein H3Z85_12330 [Chryseobacterium indologenes]|uniref:hypothetical protein n=1 Tax=Chryseobacterium TaxID=59732 RepID=UPI0003E07F6E|nr:MULTISPECIES: hypothetical protein [Chryseobacterium]QPQ50307.1 hypothetical protein H3Z85_12330 [Chryseobacterium indologenes]GAE66967.1 hypothetical protein CIN01S_28_00020 [Chryseobacterium indologenes NBRC 14944]SFK44682.1 hypothetical protein SAMN05421692_4387 [Chryseobacterium indologenes]SUX52918.1 Uncharacterised protein [Chryseobacterium indologenes]
MRKINFIIVFTLILFNCKDTKFQTKIYYPNGKLNYTSEIKKDTNKLIFFDKNEKATMHLNFYKDHFTGAICYNKNPNLPFKDSINIDSLNGPYFYGTEYIVFKNGAKRMGTYRYKRNLDFEKVLSSIQPFGIHNTFDMNGNIIGKDEYMIINDTIYNTKIVENE